MSYPWDDTEFDGDDSFNRRRERRWDDRDDNFGNRRESFSDRKPRFSRDRGRGFGGHRERDYGYRTGPRARAQVEKHRRIIDVDAKGNTVITLEEDVAKVFETSAEVNATLRKVIELAQVLGPVKGIKRPEWLDDIRAKEEKDFDENDLEEDVGLDPALAQEMQSENMENDAPSVEAEEIPSEPTEEIPEEK